MLAASDHLHCGRPFICESLALFVVHRLHVVSNWSLEISYLAR